MRIRSIRNLVNQVSTFLSWAVWPDLAKFHHFSKETFCCILGLIRILQHLVPTLAILMITIGQIFMVVKAKYWKMILPSGHNDDKYLPLSAEGCLNSWVVSHSALIIGTLCHTLGLEFNPWWGQSLFWIQVQHPCFLHDSIWLIWFDTICLSNLSCELWNRKLKIKEIYFKNNLP